MVAEVFEEIKSEGKLPNTRNIAVECHISNSTVWKVLRNDCNYKTYKSPMWSFNFKPKHQCKYLYAYIIKINVFKFGLFIGISLMSVNLCYFYLKSEQLNYRLFQ